ncbi:hypothetical protein [Terrihabitans sp. B22-R8]|uniref:hypothetical protein n=1 Tax=Terrihabitans sp. B22-R8 TaxID=3425128 RepID=UPI00403D2BEC
MMLDLYNAQLLDPSGTPEVAGPPVELGEGLSVAWREATEFSASNAQDILRLEIVSERMEEFERATGESVPLPFNLFGPASTAEAITEWADDEMPGLRERFSHVSLPGLTSAEVGDEVRKRSGAARKGLTDLQKRPQTLGGSIGQFIGSVGGALRDPINLGSMVFGAGAATGILKTALVEGGIGMASQAAVEVASSDFKQSVDPKYGASDIAGNIATAAAGGAILGAGIKGAAVAWRHVKQSSWPTSVRDAGNVIEAEDALQRSNPFSTSEAGLELRKGLEDTVSALERGEPIAPRLSEQALLDFDDGSSAILSARSGSRSQPSDVEGLDATLMAAEGFNDPVALAQRWSQDPRSVFDELDQLRTNARATEAAILKKYGKRRVSELGDMDYADPDSLTAAERKFLFYGDAPTDQESLNRIADALQPVDTLDDAVREFSVAFRGLPENPTNLDLDGRLSVARMQVLISEVQRLGGDVEDVIKDAGGAYAARFGDPDDATYMAEDVAGRLKRLFTPAAPASSPPAPAPIIGQLQQLAARAGHDLTEDEAGKLARMIVDADDDAAARMLDEFRARPATFLENPQLPRLIEPPEAILPSDPALAQRIGSARLSTPDDATTPEAIEAALRGADRLRTDDPAFVVELSSEAADGSTVTAQRNLNEVLDEIDDEIAAAEMIRGCATGGMA